MREWEVNVTRDKIQIDKFSAKTLASACYKLCEVLKNVNALHCYDRGDFITTINKFDGEIFHKRYVVNLICPYTTITIKKRTKGSIDIVEFWRTLNFVKEEYFERI